ncbi:GYDIA family GHMP kinase [Galbibacter sp. PAP.153]|uniref:GYDIA family GHMP kinase n=1 Tax=Galbibacter sp. PAP.153 TaxID=3104623 RepID=UPI00300B97ED
MTHQYRSNGKLLITGEYVVLDGALSLALPCRSGQTLTVVETNHGLLSWKALDHKDNVWFSAKIDFFKLKGFSVNCIVETNDPQKAKTLIAILTEAIKLNPGFLKNAEGIEAVTKLEFPQNWGLGSSSTLINNIASWAQVDAFALLWNSFSGSGYDIACAQNNTAINYKVANKHPQIIPVEFTPLFKEQLFFVHLNKKQNSREGIEHYKKVTKAGKKSASVKAISELTKKIQQAQTLSLFEELLKEHENIIGDLINLPPIKQRLFKDYKGTIKSLGAWGGDFMLVTGNKENVHPYFKDKGYNIIFTYQEMILS